MANDQVIVKVARLLSEGRHDETIEEANRALQAIVDERAALDERERQLLHLKSSAEIILQTIGPDTIVTNPTTLSSPVVTTDPTIRKGRILDAALGIARKGKRTFGVDDVKAELDRMEYRLDVARPGSVIGTVLNGDDRFARREMGVFEYIESNA